MTADEQAIRALITTWMEATQAGDLDRILALVDDDVVFLGPGRPPMRKAGFVDASRAREGRMRIEGSVDIQEVRVFGDWAYCWNQLTVRMTPETGGPQTTIAGPAMSLLRRKPDGRWVVFRDANMLAPAP